MAKIILLCGKICSGKTFYAEQLKSKINAVILSCDDLILTLFEEELGDRHNEVSQKCKTYLYDMAVQLITSNVNVILDFGFWTREARDSVKEVFNAKGMEVEMHYIKVDRETWLKQVESRNKLVKEGKVKAYYVDENMKVLFDRAFEEPSEGEYEVLVDN